MLGGLPGAPTVAGEVDVDLNWRSERERPPLNPKVANAFIGEVDQHLARSDSEPQP